MYESVIVRSILAEQEIVLCPPQHKVMSPDPEYQTKKTVETQRNHLNFGEAFYYANEFNLSLLPTPRAMWSPKEQQVMIPTLGQASRACGLGGANCHGDTSLIVCKRKRCG